ncbi:MAG: right-handed parallel beta-helix repeat-containing protein [Candidatus Kariarchaeaceae archaeon]
MSTNVNSFQNFNTEPFAVFSSSLTLSDGISINSNAELLEFVNNSTVEGDGSVESPYFVTNMAVNDSLIIRDTDVYFSIRNWTFNFRVQFFDVENFAIENSRFEGNLWFESCKNISVKSSISEGVNLKIHTSGISILNSSEITLQNYQTYGEYWTGIAMSGSTDVVVEDITFNHQGYELDISYLRFDSMHNLRVSNVTSSEKEDEFTRVDVESWWHLVDASFSNINLPDLQIRFSSGNSLIVENSNFSQGEFSVQDGNNITFQGNTFDQGHLRLFRSSKIFVSNNTFSNYTIGISVLTVNKTEIRSNHFINLGTGISISSDSDITISQNTFENVDDHVNDKSAQSRDWDRWILLFLVIFLIFVIRIRRRRGRIKSLE